MANVTDMLVDGFNMMNPVNQKLNKKMKRIIDVLLANGATKDEIIKFIYTSESDVSKYIDKRISEVMKGIQFPTSEE